MMVNDEGSTPPWVTSDHDRSVSPEPCSIDLHTSRGPGRAGVEAYLEAAYARAFDGRIRRHYPMLMSVRDAQGVIQAAVGFRFADEAPLFLEQYLDEPVENAITRVFRGPAARNQIAEIGNLAARDHAASLLLFQRLAGHLLARDRTHAVATVTRQLRRRFRRLGFVTQSLTPAGPEKLSSGVADWGGYYARDPEVLAGAIGQTWPSFAQAGPEGGGERAQ
jgi:hypothetical protein